MTQGGCLEVENLALGEIIETSYFWSLKDTEDLPNKEKQVGIRRRTLV